MSFGASLPNIATTVYFGAFRIRLVVSLISYMDLRTDGQNTPMGGEINPLKDSTVPPLISRCNSKRLRSNEGKDHEPSSSSRVPIDLRDRLADAVSTQMDISHDGAISAAHRTREVKVFSAVPQSAFRRREGF